MSSENLIPLSEHERFEQMCALLALGELPDEDFQELQRHLGECAPCQQLYDDFCRIGSDDLGFAVAHRQSEAPIPGTPSIPKEASPYLNRLRDRIADLDQSGREVKATAKRSGWQHLWDGLMAFRTNPIVAWATAVLVILALASIGYRRYEQAATRAETAEAQSRSLRVELEQRDAQKTAAPQSARQEDRQENGQELLTTLRANQDQLQRDLAESNAKNIESQVKTADLTKLLSEASARADLAARALLQAENASQNESQKRNESEQQLRSALQQMKDLRDQRTEALLQASDQERQISDLKTQLSTESAALERTEAAVAGTGLEGRNLFGARTLHIVDVYDVDGKGNTKRTFGRVYYVEKKLLVFYAFDLEGKRQNQLAAGFQAWGYREVGSTKPDNLGMFHLDDPALNRWALSVNDPRVLEHIDAVFVTLEPPEGSPTPKGRRLLYASLAGAPNHP
jgi:hypothetical protein